jgi:N-acetyl-beta-hexosaminidase
MLNVIPLPAKCEERYGEFVIGKDTKVYADKELQDIKEFFREIPSRACGYSLDISETPAEINFIYERHVPKEGYRLECTAEKLEITASELSGAFYAVQTARQLLNADVVDKAEILTMHAVLIEDAPRYKWRGLMLDESRHFFGKAFVEKLLELMACHKLNVFHWHLTDNEGWRVDIKKYPKLKEIGSVRAGTQTSAWKRADVEEIPYAGCYSREDIKEIVAFAQKLRIMIVPEIDMPAHFGAALAAYPELGCRGVQMEPPVVHSDGSRGYNGIIACAGKERVYRFVYDVIDELSELFPAPYFHIGGDEAPKKEWKECPDCQKIIKDKGLKDEEELQGYFNNKIALYLKTKGKRMIGWNEILKASNLESSAIVQYWIESGEKLVSEAVASGRTVVISKRKAFYFDMPYAFVNLKTTYNYEPEFGSKGVSGVEATLWTEWMRTPERVWFQLFPRMEALAEAAWTPKDLKSYPDFRKRLAKFLPILLKRGLDYAPESFIDRRGLSAAQITAKFNTIDAHCEYKKAMTKSRKYK